MSPVQRKHSSGLPLPQNHQETFAGSPDLTDFPRIRGQKRSCVPEDGPPRKRLQKDPQSVGGFGQPLSEANLRKHNNILTGSEASDEMGPVRLKRGALKRSFSSRESSNTDVNQQTASAQTQNSSYTNAHYRLVNLRNLRIFILPVPPPEEIQPRINDVIQREISKERKDDLSRIAKTLCENFAQVLIGANREDDCIDPFRHTLTLMDGDKKFDFPRKADWNPCLKPNVQQKSWPCAFLNKPNDIVDDYVTEPRKPQQVNSSKISPKPSQSRSKQAITLVKTPRPDVTVGFRHSTMIEAFGARDLNQVDASDFLEALQQQQLLCSDPTRQALIRFPFMVIEGKSYATGKTMYEAQNQAAVSGSCMVNLQHILADLTKRASPESHHSKAPLAFSICSEGPQLELWVHYTTFQDGVRMYDMRILDTCHVGIPGKVTGFLVMVDAVMNWARTDFVNDIAEQLVLIERAGREQHIT